jgi:hypothetical protein
MNGTPLSVLYHRYMSSPLGKYDMSYEQFVYYYTKWVNEYNCSYSTK